MFIGTVWEMDQITEDGEEGDVEAWALMQIQSCAVY